jgi:hypothetical protein
MILCLPSAGVTRVSHHMHLYFLAVLEFELRTSHLLAKISTAQVTLPVLFALIIFQMRFWTFCSGLPQTSILLPTPPMWLGLQKCTTTSSLLAEVGESH